MPDKHAYALGLDFGTNSARALIADLRNGRELASAVAAYPGGDQGVLTDAKDPNLARQNPADYAAAMTRAVRTALRIAQRSRGFSPDRIVGIGVDATASTPLPVDAACRPLALDPAFRRNRSAAAWLWKDHTSHAEAREITELARRARPEYLARCGGVYSSEWFWSKALHCARIAPDVLAKAASWVELCDYIPALLTGCDDVRRMKRGVCAAGHKALFDPKCGLPDAEFLGKLHPALADLRGRLYTEAHASDRPAGGLSEHWFRTLGLAPGTPVAVGGIDAHVGAVGAGIRPGTLVKILGTSACDMLITPGSGVTPQIPGTCGVVLDSIVPGFFGIEAGQPAVGDIFNWWVTRIDPRRDGHARLTRAAARLRAGQSGLLALDWNNGNRSILVDVRLTGVLVGQTLRTDSAEVYRALLEATAFGARVIVERLREYGARVDEMVLCGGIAEKSPLTVQIYADVLGLPMKLSRSAQTCALGAAIFGAVAAGPQHGGFSSVPEAQERLCAVKSRVFRPEPEATRTYSQLYRLYRRLHDAFGGVPGGTAGGELGSIIKELLEVRDRVRARA